MSLAPNSVPRVDSASRPHSPPLAPSAIQRISSEQDRSSNHSSPKQGNRSLTDPEPTHLRIKKRIVVCCDGTWQDGLVVSQRWKYTNVLRLARSINHVDMRFSPPMPQIVFYQSGVGSEPNHYLALLDGAVGATLGEKVQEAYAFIAHNYEQGDEIFLFGFSRGAYTARMIAYVIGYIGVLDRTEMDHFASIFMNLQKRGKEKDPEKIKQLDAALKPWTQDDSHGKKRVNCDNNAFIIKVVGVFDTVGSLGLPEELTRSKNMKTLFGFPDSTLGTYIERAYQALAMNETRADFNCNKFYQTDEGKRKNQVLKQCWFTGSHSDIGGGFKEHDLSDLTLAWMASHIEDALSLDHKYLDSLVGKPSAPWGAQEPHDPTTGIFSLATTIQRKLPTAPDATTNEKFHPSVLHQDTPPPGVQLAVKQYPELLEKLMPLEEQWKMNWPYKPDANGHSEPNKQGNQTAKTSGLNGGSGKKSILGKAKDALIKRTRSESEAEVPTLARSGNFSAVDTDWVKKVTEESSFGALLKELLGK